MSTGSATVIVPTLGGASACGGMLASVASADHQTIVVDNGSGGGVAAALRRARRGRGPAPRAQRRLHAARSTSALERADGDVIVLLNDDCVCDPGFVERITAPIDPGGGRRDGGRA